MRLEHLVAIGVRLFSIGLAINILRALSNFSFFWESVTDFIGRATYIGSTIALILLVILLWKFPLTIAKKIGTFPALQTTELNSESHKKLLEIGLILLGLYLLFYAISDATYWLAFYWQTLSYNYPASGIPLPAEDMASIVATCVEFVFAGYLIFGHKALANIVQRLRGS